MELDPSEIMARQHQSTGLEQSDGEGWSIKKLLPEWTLGEILVGGSIIGIIAAIVVASL